MSKAFRVAAVLALGASLPAAAQSAADVCSGVPASYVPRCVAAVQAADAAQAQMGILVAGGTPALGAGRGAAPRAGFARHASVSGRANLVMLTIPHITSEENGPTPPPLLQQMSLVAVAVGVDASVGLAPRVELLANATYLPFDLVSREVFNPSSAQFAGGAGIRVGVLRESAALPAVSLSVMYHGSVGDLHLGDVCEAEERTDPTSTSDPATTLCSVDGDVAQARLALGGWSTRASVAKRLGGFGVTLGAGYDRYSGGFNVDLLGARGTPANRARVFHTPRGELGNDRFSGFLGASYAVPLGSLVAELGWMQGGDRVPGFSEESAFDPGAGRVFGSFGARFAL